MESVLYEALPEDETLVELEPDGAAECFDVVRGILFGVTLCLPFWAAVYLLVRSI